MTTLVSPFWDAIGGMRTESEDHNGIAFPHPSLYGSLKLRLRDRPILSSPRPNSLSSNADAAIIGDLLFGR